MKKTLDSVKDKLQATGIGTWKAATGWGITIGRLPSTPDTSVSVVPGPSLPPNPKYLLDYPSIQVLVRGDTNGYVEALEKAQKVKDVLLGLASQDVNGDRWVQINMIGDIMYMGDDDKRRPMFSTNFQFIIEPATNADTNRIAL